MHLESQGLIGVGIGCRCVDQISSIDFGNADGLCRRHRHAIESELPRRWHAGDLDTGQSVCSIIVLKDPKIRCAQDLGRVLGDRHQIVGRCRGHVGDDRRSGVNAVVGTGRDGARIARLVGVGAGQADDVADRFDIGSGREVCRPGFAAVIGGNGAERAALGCQIAGRKAGHGLTEADGDLRGFGNLQRSFADRQGGHGGFGVDGIRGGLRRVIARVACNVGVGPCERDPLPHQLRIQGGREGACPCLSAVGAAECVHCAALHSQVAAAEVGNRFREAHRQGGCFTGFDLCARERQGCRWQLGVHRETGTGRRCASIARQVGVAAGQGECVIGTVQIGRRVERGGPGFTLIAGGEAAEGATGNGQIRGIQAGHFFAEREGDRGGISSRDGGRHDRPDGRWGRGVGHQAGQ